MFRRKVGQCSAGAQRRLLRALFGALLAGTASLAAPAASALDLTVGIHLISAEVARTDEQRERGLMFRESMPTNHGMLFVFDQDGKQCMWMRNTPLPLAVAFLDADGTIANVEEMRPNTDSIHCSVRPVRYALEMNAKWFEQRKIKAGHAIRGLPAR